MSTVVIGGAIVYYQLTRFRGYGETQLALPWWAALCVILTPFALLAAIPHTRRVFLILWWLNISRHRLRSFMHENNVRNNSGRLPWLICIYPTKVGERAWMWLPAGISEKDINDEIDSLGPTCYGREGYADVPFKNKAHIVRINIHRRDILETHPKVKTTLIGKGEELDLLPATVSSSIDTPSQWAVGIGLPHTASDTTSNTHTTPSRPSNGMGSKKAINQTTTVPVRPAAVTDSGEDLTNYV